MFYNRVLRSRAVVSTCKMGRAGLFRVSPPSLAARSRGNASAKGDKRIEKDSMGEVEVPKDALYGAQTQRAVNNFQISGQTFGRTFLRALGYVKSATAQANLELGLFDTKTSRAIQEASEEVAEGKWDAEFPIDIFQTGSGTSTNMNANEVIARRAGELMGGTVHPNDHVNMSQSSNDVIPTTIHVAACLAVAESLLPGLLQLHQALLIKAEALDGVVKTGRAHLMDATPIRMSQEIGAWAAQVQLAIERVEGTMGRAVELAQGGTAVGSGVNAHEEFAGRVAAALEHRLGIKFKETRNHFAAQSCMDTAVELSGQVRCAAVALTKIADDLRWLNSGPLCGLGEIQLEALQPGSSIMPGKVNPVVCESVLMVAAQVVGCDAAVAAAGSRGNFQLNTMLPVIAHNLVQSIEITGKAAMLLATKGIESFEVNSERIEQQLSKNPILITALNRKIGYDVGAKIAKRAYAEKRSVKDVAKEETGMSEEELAKWLDPRAMTHGGVGDEGPHAKGTEERGRGFGY